ncbi:MAG: diacylglycerol kinase family protein [Thermoguttaceae bacterium]
MQPAADNLSPGTDRVLILVNPKAGAQSALSRADRLADLAGQRGFHVEVHADLGQAASLANQWHTAGRLRALVGVGGDGTAAELVNRTAAGVPLTILPAGNENLLARYLGLSETPEGCCQTLAEAKVVRLDAARAGQRVFLVMASCGLDADVVHRLHARRTGHVRSRSYFKPILDSIRSYQYPEFEICRSEAQADGQPRWSAPEAVRWLFAFNVPRYGGGLRIAPQADPADGLLDICTFRRGGWWRGLWYTAAVLAGRHRRLADCGVGRAARLRITSEEQVPYQLDGDLGGFLPVEIEILPMRMTLLVPSRA